MKLVLLSGGSGKRLWPLSNDSRSKQFLKVLPSERDSIRESMVQRVWRQLGEVGLQEKAFITAGSVQIDVLRQQLGAEAKFINEPERRDTLAAILLSVLFLYENGEVESDDTVVILPVDPYVQVELFEKLLNFDEILSQTDAEIALIGVKPTYPSAKYGYIMPNSNRPSTLLYDWVEKCIEKPNEEKAKELIEEGGLWNCGIFAFRTSFILNKIAEYRLPTEYSQFLERYDEVKKTSFDYEILERSSKVVVSVYEGDWKDLGTWNTLTEEIAENMIGKGKIASDCHNTHVINELSIPIFVLGISNAVIAAGPEGILVTDKPSSPRLKELLTDFKQRPMYEETRWGWYKIIEHQVESNSGYLICKIKIFQEFKIDQAFFLESLYYRGGKVSVTVVSGEGVLINKMQESPIASGYTFNLSHDESQEMLALKDLELIAVVNFNEEEPQR